MYSRTSCIVIEEVFRIVSCNLVNRPGLVLSADLNYFVLRDPLMKKTVLGSPTDYSTN